MTAITYTAKRNIAPGSFFSSGTDILASTLADDLQSTTTDLSGLASGAYIYVTGFATWPNYGWHTLASASSAHSIPVTTNLVDEAAGATITIQEYLHLYGSSYQLECKPVELTPWEQADAEESISQGGLEQSILRRIDTGYTFTTSVIADADLKFWREFTQSVMGKEPFIFDALGFVGAADNPESVTLQSRPAWTRISNLGWQLSLRLRVI